MPSSGSSSSHHGRCGCHSYEEVDSHLFSDADGEAKAGGQARGNPTIFCPGASEPHYAPDLTLEPIHIDITLHVDLEQQCMVVDELISVRCNVGTSSNSYALSLDGIGFQHLHASRVLQSQAPSSVPSSPRYPSPPAHTPESSTPQEPPPSRVGALLQMLRPSDKKIAAPSPTKPTNPGHTGSAPLHHSDPHIQPLTASEPVRDNVSFYCTYDGRQIALSWVGHEAFNGGTAGAVEKVRLIYLVDKPITGLYFTKPPTEVELEGIDQQQKPLVQSSFATPKRSESAGNENKRSLTSSASSSYSIPPQPVGVSPFHSSRPLLACTDHETERARYWLATIDQPGVRPTYKMTFLIRAGLTALANGELLSQSTTEAAPVWPLSLFNPPITSPKPPTYGRAVFVWNNPYPTAAYLVTFAVGQLHYHEAIPPRPKTSTSNISAHAPSTPQRGHKRTQSDDFRLHSSAESSRASSALRLTAISEGSDLSTGASTMDFATLGAEDVASHHKLPPKRREEAPWVLSDIPMRYYTPRNVPLSTVQLMLSRTPEIMKWLQGRFGIPFPFPLKYYQFVGPELPSAMENITLTTWGGFYLLNPVWALEYGQSTESINVHEMGHSYFGDSVGIKFWDHAWLKEGWANYIECLWQEDKYGPDAFSYMLWRNGKLYQKESDNLYARPIVTARYDSSWDLYDQHLYRGGSRRIHALRCILGDDVFWPAITDYLRTYRGKLVETEDFRRILEKHSHRNLQPFFNQWLYSPGYPQISASFEYSSQHQQVIIHAQQTQMDAARGIKTFAMNIPVDIAYLAPSPSSSLASSTASSISSSGSTASSKIKWLKTELVFANGSAEAHLTVPLTTPPLQVIFDKKHCYPFTLTMDPGFTVLRTMALHCWSVPHRIWAAQNLLERGGHQEIEVISEMLLNREQFWGVIADVAFALAKPHRSAQAATILCKLLLCSETHPSHQPRALMSIANALAQITDPRIAVTIRQYLAMKRCTSLYKLDEKTIRAINSSSNLAALAEQAEAMNDSAPLDLDEESSEEEFHGTSTTPRSAPLPQATETIGSTIPYKTHARLLSALVAQGDYSDEPLLIEQAERSRYGWLGIVRSGALVALAEMGTPSAFEYILLATRITQHQHLKARASAVGALAQCVYKAKMSSPLLTRATHTLHLLLHDQNYGVRIAAVHALFKLIPHMQPSTAQESLNQIRHIRKTLSNQDRMWLKRKKLLIKGEGKITKDKPKTKPTAAASSESASSLPSLSGGPTMEEFLTLKHELNALKARVSNIETQMEDDSDNEH